MEKQKIYTFLQDLSENNSKEWMHAHKKRYQEVRNMWIDIATAILDRLKAHDPTMEKMNPKKTIMRITNNRRFHPDKPLYRDNFAFAPVADMNQPAFYLHVSPKETFIGGGVYKSPSPVIKKVREAINYNGEILKEIVSTAPFSPFYAGLSDDPDQLKSAPRGYSVDHPHIDLLRRKSFTAIKPLQQADFLSEDFIDLAEEAYLAIRPMNDYLREAILFEE